MSDSFHQDILNLQKAYRSLWWWQKLFFPWELGSRLERYQGTTTSDQFAIFTTFEQNTGFWQQWLFPSLITFHESYNTCVFRSLRSDGLLAGDAAQANFNAVVAHQKPGDVTDALGALNRYGLLTGDAAQANFNAVVAHQSPYGVCMALDILHRAGLLTGDAAQANFNAVVAHENPGKVAWALRTLRRAGLLTGDAAQANFNAVVAHQKPLGVCNALGILDEAGLLTGDAAQANFNAVVAHQNPNDVACALDALHSAGLLTGDAAQDNFNALVAHQNPGDVAWVLVILRLAGLLTGAAAQDNFNAVVAYQSPDDVAWALDILHSTGLLTGDAAQGNFNALVITHAAILLHENNNVDGVHMWSTIPYGRPTAAEFQAMITIAGNHAHDPAAGSRVLVAYVNATILGINGQARAFNGNQSTHTASVHASVSRTARNLFNRYGSRIQGRGLNDTLQVFATWVAQAPNSPKQQAAVRCINRLVNEHYQDAASQVSTRQFLALAWIAIHDDKMREGTLDDAQQQLINGLYEIQRGYNLSETGVDNNDQRDISICTAGTFNKICEKLAGYHPDAVILYITKEGASAKLRIVAIEEAQHYLNRLTPGTQEFLNAQQSLENDEMQPLWDIISPNVGRRLFEEFGSLYPAGIQSPDYSAFLNTGLYALTQDKLVLANTPNAIATNPHAFFAENNPNPAAEAPPTSLNFASGM